MPATLLSIDASSGHSVSKTPVNNILTVGRLGHVAYFLTLGTTNKNIQRYWIRSFDCKTAGQARATVRHIVELAANAMPGYGSQVCSMMGGGLPTVSLRLRSMSSSP